MENVLKIGLFFDGTGENGYNSELNLQVRIDIEEAAKHKAQQLLDMFKPKQMPQNIIAQEDTLMNNTKNTAMPISSVEKEAQKIH